MIYYRIVDIMDGCGVAIDQTGNKFNSIQFKHTYPIRERPFDFQGGGGLENNILALIFVKKNILASTQTKKNSLTLGMRKKITALLRDKKNQLSRWWKKIRPSQNKNKTIRYLIKQNVKLTDLLSNILVFNNTIHKICILLHNEHDETMRTDSNFA